MLGRCKMERQRRLRRGGWGGSGEEAHERCWADTRIGPVRQNGAAGGQRRSADSGNGCSWAQEAWGDGNVWSATQRRAKGNGRNSARERLQGGLEAVEVEVEVSDVEVKVDVECRGRGRGVGRVASRAEEQRGEARRLKFVAASLKPGGQVRLTRAQATRQERLRGATWTSRVRVRVRMREAAALELLRSARVAARTSVV